MVSVILPGGGYRIYESPESSFVAMPYFGSHPTGIVFNMDEYRLLKNRNYLFTKEAAYIHPHDLILGRLSQYGEMFQFKKIWSLAGTDSFSKNKSFLYKQGTVDDAWFSPKARTQEFRLFITDIAASSFNKELKHTKAVQVAKRYLFYCTLNYAFFISDAGQTAHYGIEPKELTRNELSAIMQKFVDESYQTLLENGLGGKKEKYKTALTSYFWAIYFGKPIWDKMKKLRK